MKVAKLEKNKIKKEQSIYMPQIPEITSCPEHLLPLKQWAVAFLTDFSELCQVCSFGPTSCSICTEKLMSVTNSESE